MIEQTNLVVLAESEEAASIKTVTGWVSRTGRFWGEDEFMARWDGSTHKVCECGDLITKNSFCIKCHYRREHEKYIAMTSVTWDGEVPLNLYGTDIYFFDEDSILDHCANVKCQPQDLPLVICVPKFATPIDGTEHFSDDLPEDCELPEVITVCYPYEKID